MKRNILIIGTALLMLLGSASCRKCVVCTDNNNNSVKYCSDSETNRNNFAQSHTLLGQTCTDTY